LIKTFYSSLTGSEFEFDQLYFKIDNMGIIYKLSVNYYGKLDIGTYKV
jgi:hypothetical protein